MENKEQLLKDIERLADLLFTRGEIHKMTGIIIRIGMDGDANDLNEAYEKGKFTRQIKLRASLLQLAENGSHPALEKAFALFDKQNSADV